MTNLLLTDRIRYVGLGDRLDALGVVKIMSKEGRVKILQPNGWFRQLEELTELFDLNCVYYHGKPVDHETYRVHDPDGDAFRPGPNVLCRNQNGSVIPSQQLGKRIASSTQQEIHCSGGLVQINQHHYRGDVSLLKGQGDWLPVVSLDLETYVASVVGAEMPSQWHQEALKAQAVAARSYAMAHLARPATTAYHLGDTTRWQVFAGEKSTTQASHSATRETRGMILSYGGGIVESLYASNAQVSAEAHGHLGASMSQTGAQQLARQGLPFNAILGRYYAGASLARLTWHDQ